MSKFIMLIGLPGSGKSTYVTRYESKNTNTAIVCPDDIREELTGNVNDQSHNTEVFEIAYKRIKEFLEADLDVIFDATNLNRKRRISLLKTLPKDTLKIAVVFAVAFSLCKEQNEQRSRVVPYDVMDRMYKNFQVPWFGEGFNAIQIEGSPTYKEEIARRQIMEIENITKCCEHDNPHHKETLGNHSLKAWENAHNIILRDNLDFKTATILLEACRYHDLGKWYCKQFINSKGEHTKEAHYYNHENVSAYIYLSTMFATPTLMNSNDYLIHILTVANLINNHMLPFNNLDYLDKLKEVYDDNFCYLIEKIHECDLVATEL